MLNQNAYIRKSNSKDTRVSIEVEPPSLPTFKTFNNGGIQQGIVMDIASPTGVTTPLMMNRHDHSRESTV